MNPSEALQRLCSDDPSWPPPRTLLVVAHPDDEVVGAASRLPRLAPALHLAFVTDGAPHNPHFHERLGFPTRDAYRVARQAEARAALALAGVEPERSHGLGLADQGASLALADLARKILQLAVSTAPDAVLTHAFEGGHPDHDAASFATHAAIRLLRREGAAPALLEFASYNEQRGAFSAYEFHAAPDREAITVALSPAQQELKRRMIDCHASQHDVLAQFPLEREAFRVAPDYDFIRPPQHALYYDRFDWGMRGERFRQLARSALEELGL